MAYSGPSGTENTYYATPSFEIVATSAGTDYRHYLYAAGSPKLVISRTTAGAVNVRSLLTNHQGSVSSIIANSTGTNLVSESFTAYGNRREASTWSGSPTSGELSTMNGVTREGYTFQTVLGSMGLNHMNGRIEDSVTGRFLSVDPHAGLGGAQTFNSYTYAGNNPLSAIDPTGFDTCYVAGCDQNANSGDVAHWRRYTGPEGSIGSTIVGVDFDNGSSEGIGFSGYAYSGWVDNYNGGAQAGAPNLDYRRNPGGTPNMLPGGSITIEDPDGQNSKTYNFPPRLDPQANSALFAPGQFFEDSFIQQAAAGICGNFCGASGQRFVGPNYAKIFNVPAFVGLQPLMNALSTGFFLELGGLSIGPSISLPNINGAVVAAGLELGSQQLNQYAIKNVVEEAYAEVLEALENAGNAYKALEEATPEVAGPPILWGPP